MHDLISDSITRIRNASRASLDTTYLITNNLIRKMLSILYTEGYISGYKSMSLFEYEVLLKYRDAQPAIQQIKRISKPGSRVYCSVSNLKKWKLRYPNSLFILSTNRGILTDTQALSYQIGGELICWVQG